MPSSHKRPPEDRGDESQSFTNRLLTLLSALTARSSIIAGGITAVCVFLVIVGPAAAGNGLTLSKQPRDTLSIPQWLYLMTGSAAIGASALLASFVTDRFFIQRLERYRRHLLVERGWIRVLRRVTQLLGVSILILVLYVGYTGPSLPTSNLAILVTFAGARAGLPILAYLVGNTWPALNPWHTIATVVPSGFITYPDSWHRWPAVAGVLFLVWVELIFPISTVPGTLVAVIAVYSIVTISGGIIFGPKPWFENADPWSVLFRFFGAAAPVYRENGGIGFRLPASALTDSDFLKDLSDIAFIIALIWELTFSGFITTQTGATVVETIVTAVPSVGLAVEYIAVPVYTLLLIGGYLVFFYAYWYASQLSRRWTRTYIDSTEIAFRFAPPLIAIAAGYHFAHYAELFVTLAPALATGILSPLSPPANPTVLSIPAWFDGLKIAAVLIGHLLAVFAAHGVAYDTFSSRMVAIRSQYPFVLVMIGYTAVSLWILSLTGAIPPYLP